MKAEELLDVLNKGWNESGRFGPEAIYMNPETYKVFEMMLERAGLENVGNTGYHKFESVEYTKKGLTNLLFKARPVCLILDQKEPIVWKLK